MRTGINDHGETLVHALEDVVIVAPPWSTVANLDDFEHKLADIGFHVCRFCLRHGSHHRYGDRGPARVVEGFSRKREGAALIGAYYGINRPWSAYPFGSIEMAAICSI